MNQRYSYGNSIENVRNCVKKREREKGEYNILSAERGGVRAKNCVNRHHKFRMNWYRESTTNPKRNGAIKEMLSAQKKSENVIVLFRGEATTF